MTEEKKIKETKKVNKKDAKKQTEEKSTPKNTKLQSEASKAKEVIAKEVEETKNNPKKDKQDESIKKKKKSHWKTIVILIILAILVNQVFFNDNSFFNHNKLFNEPAAFINGEKLTVKELDEQYSRLPTEYKAFMDEYTILERMIDFEVVRQAAQKEGVTVTDEEIESIVLGLRGPTTDEEFVNQVKFEYKKYKNFENELKKTLLVQKYISNNVPEFNFTQEDINTVYEEYLMRNPSEKFAASHILICYEGSQRCEKNRTQEEAIVLINEIYAKSKTENFSELAKEYSEGPSAINGGDLGWFAKGQMVENFENTVMELEVGEISEPVETEFGYHIIKLNDKQENTVYTQEEIKTFLGFSLFSSLQTIYQSEFTNFVEELKKNAEIEIVINKEDYINVVEISSAEELGEIIDARNKQIQETVNEDTTTTKEDITVNDTIVNEDNLSCFSQNAITQKLIFYGNSASEKSNNLKEMILTDYIDINKDSDLSIIKTCIDNFNEVLFPQVICTTNDKVLIGEQTKENLDIFIAEC